MTLRLDEAFPTAGLQLLRECYAFVNKGWQHSVRMELPDQGFEIRFRESCVERLQGWIVSQERELHLGYGLDTASGLSHEVDLILRFDDVTGIVEMKNRHGFLPEKNDVIVFFAKILDYLALSPLLLQRDIVPVFMSCFPFEQSGLAACLGLGIHPIAPQLRPLPLLLDNVRRIQNELGKGVTLSSIDQIAFEDLCAGLNRLSMILAPGAINRRCDYFNERTITVSAVTPQPTRALSDELLVLNARNRTAQFQGMCSSTHAIRPSG